MTGGCKQNNNNNNNNYKNNNNFINQFLKMHYNNDNNNNNDDNNISLCRCKCYVKKYTSAVLKSSPEGGLEAWRPLM